MAMKAVRLIKTGDPLELQEIPIPKIGPRDILVKVKAAGICHSDAHYRSGISMIADLPLTLGHEVAGIVERIGAEVITVMPKDRVCLHYLLSCENCYYCASGNEQFCSHARMLGHHIDGGYAEYIAVPARNALPIPVTLSFEDAATLMCASATAFHALLKARIKPGDRVAVFGIGGLGFSAVQLAKIMGAKEVFAVDINPEKLALAADSFGVVPINGQKEQVVAILKQRTGGRGVDVALELIGLPATQKQAVSCVGPMGRVVFVGLAKEPITLDSYRDILGNEVELIGSNDHCLHELPKLLGYADQSILDVSKVVGQCIPLDAAAINKALDDFEQFHNQTIRTVIVPDL